MGFAYITHKHTLHHMCRSVLTSQHVWKNARTSTAASFTNDTLFFLGTTGTRGSRFTTCAVGVACYWVLGVPALTSCPDCEISMMDWASNSSEEVPPSLAVSTLGSGYVGGELNWSVLVVFLLFACQFLWGRYSGCMEDACIVSTWSAWGACCGHRAHHEQTMTPPSSDLSLDSSKVCFGAIAQVRCYVDSMQCLQVFRYSNVFGGCGVSNK